MWLRLASVGLVPPVRGAGRTPRTAVCALETASNSYEPVTTLTVAWTVFCRKGQWAGGQGWLFSQ